MARITRRIHVDRAPAEVFDAIADFTTTAQWDPGIRAARPVHEPPVGDGARTEVVLALGPLAPRLTYATIIYERPHRVVLESRSLLAVGIDDVSVASDGSGGSMVTWQADFRLRGPGRFVDPLLALGFRRVGEKAVDGLEAWLDAGGRATYAPTAGAA